MFKACLGLVWFFVAYVVRIYVNLLIEPQVNPIKHFPVVTVSHKVILPMSLKLTRLLAAPLSPLGPRFALFIAGTTVLLLPGVFGFLVWELKENWRLYEANRAESLRPVLVGDHGETMGSLLRPGIHSGTLPKLFAKLRKAERRATRRPRRAGDVQAARDPAPRRGVGPTVHRARLPRPAAREPDPPLRADRGAGDPRRDQPDPDRARLVARGRNRAGIGRLGRVRRAP